MTFSINEYIWIAIGIFLGGGVAVAIVMGIFACCCYCCYTCVVSCKSRKRVNSQGRVETGQVTGQAADHDIVGAPLVSVTIVFNSSLTSFITGCTS